MKTEIDLNYEKAMKTYHELEENFHKKIDDYHKQQKIMNDFHTEKEIAFKILDSYIRNELLEAQKQKYEQDHKVG